MRPASQYWICEVDGFSTKTSTSRSFACFQELARATLGQPEAQLTDISAVMAKIEEVVSSLTKPEDRLPMTVLYFSCKFIAPEADRSAK